MMGEGQFQLVVVRHGQTEANNMRILQVTCPHMTTCDYMQCCRGIWMETCLRLGESRPVWWERDLSPGILILGLSQI